MKARVLALLAAAVVASAYEQPPAPAAVDPAAAAAPDAPAPLHPLRDLNFQPDHASVAVEQTIEHGAVDTYRVVARAGQHADFVFTDATAASFVIYRPPSTVTTSAAGVTVAGPVLGAGDPGVPSFAAGAAKHWAGTLPASGPYFIRVAADIGDARYRLKVKIR